MKKLMVSVLALCLIVSNVFAANFPDIKGHWAESYIKEIAGGGIVNGYSDGTFKPDNKVTKCESVLMMYRMYKSLGFVDKSQEQLLTNRYAGVMDSNNIPKWEGLRESIAYFLEHNIIPTEDLSDFLRGNQHVNMTRERLSFYLGKSLNMHLQADIGGVIESVFKDMGEINGAYINYIDLLFKNKIVSGDNKGYFNPKNSITRAEFTKLIVESLKTLKKEKNAAESTVKVRISTKLDSLNKVIFHDIEEKTKVYQEVIDKDVEVIVAGEKAGYKDLMVDMPATLTYINEKLIKVEAKEKEISYTSEVKDGPVTEILLKSGSFYYRDLSNDKLNFINVTEKTPLFKNGEKTNLKDVTVGDYAAITYKNGELVEINFKTKSEKFEGVISEIEIGDNASLKIKIGENVKEFKFSKNAVIKRDLSISTISDLKVEDNVVLETEYGRITKLDVSAKTKTISGKVVKLSKGDVNTLTISVKNSENQVFEIPENVNITVDGRKAGLFDIKIDNYVKIKFDGEVIAGIKAESKMVSNGYTGVILKIHDDVNVLIIETDEKNISVSTNKDNTIIVGEDGNKTTFSSLKTNQKVFVYGVKEDVYLNAKKIVILQ